MISPGPCTPDQAGICLELVEAAARTKTPLFGVCLGLQSIAQAFGGNVTRAPTLMHGKVSRVAQVGSDSFLAPIEREFQATRYHSLVADAASFPACLRVVANSIDDSEIMAIEHETLPIAAVQFHPESIASEAGPAMIDSFMKWARARTQRLGATHQGAAQ
jgi:anthranilate synthase/aminodeoxychorismate synthase-like glutamine amidotransferase